MNIARRQKESVLPQGVYPIIDYSLHPAFQKFKFARAEDERPVSEALSKIDDILADLIQPAKFRSNEQLDGIFLNEIDPELKRMRDFCSKRSDLGQILTDSFVWTGKYLRNYAGYRNETKRYRAPRNRPGSADKVREDLEQDAISMCRLAPSTITELRACFDAPIKELNRLKKEKPESYCQFHLKLDGPYWDKVYPLLVAQGFVDGASGYLGHELSPCYAVLSLAHPKQTWWRDCYQDINVPTANTVYLHNDEDYDVMKMIIYLGDVEEPQGPFTIIRGSHKWRRSESQFTLFKAFDFIFGEALKTKPPVGSSYYRKRFLGPYRELLAALPRALQGSSHFGDDIIDGSPLSEHLLSQVFQVTSDVGNCMIFNGGLGIHRGSCATNGERLILHIALRYKPKTQISFGQKARRFAGRGLRTLLGDSVIDRLKSGLKG